MKMRRIFSAFLAVVMLLSVMPALVTGASAAEDTTGGLFLDKTATLTNDGTYTIDLEAYATGTPVVSQVKEGIPLDIVMVVDHSGSMQTQGYLESLKAAVAKFVHEISENGKSFNVNHRIAITTFANKGKGTQTGTQEDSDFSYVGTKDPNWGNTGLFKNDGTFENYGSPIYKKVTSQNSITTSGNTDRNSKYYIQIETADGKGEWVQIQYLSNAWRYFSDGSDYGTSIGNTSTLWSKYEVYEYTGSDYNLDNEDYKNAWIDVRSGDGVNPVITNAISSFAANGPTYPAAAMDMAMKALENLPMSGEERNKLVVVFTDGQPGFSSFEEAEANAALESASVIKNAGIEIYTIGLYKTASTNNTNFMNYLSSNYGPVTNMDGEGGYGYTEISGTATAANTSGNSRTNYYVLDEGVYRQVYTTRGGSTGNRNYTWWYYDENNQQVTIQAANNSRNYSGTRTLYEWGAVQEADKYYHTTADMNQLSGIFQTITVDSTTTDTTIALGVDAIVRDVMATGFELTENTVITVKTQPGRYTGDLDAFQITEDQISWGAASTVATMNYPENDTITQNGYTITVTESDVAAHGSTVDVTGFNFHEKYICNGHDGYRLLVTITGVKADASLATGTKVFTNHGSSGVYEPAHSDVDQDGVPGEAQGSFENPTTYFNPVTYVMDYAKPMTTNAGDMKLNQIVNADNDGYNYFAQPNMKLTANYGQVTVSASAFGYTPVTMKWNGYDTFYLFGTTADAEIKAADANANGNVWSKVTVIPANNVYYEDTFVQGENSVEVGIEFGDGWTLENTTAPGSNVENPESGENTEDDDQGGVHGWEDSLADDTGYSDGTAHVAGSGATATFTFTGTGVDIYSRTNMNAGLIMANIYSGEEASGLPLRTLLIDNFSHSGDYYMIPTLAIHQQIKRVNGQTQFDKNGVMILEPMPHGTYTVKLTVIATTDDADFDGEKETRSTYYLDGIRVYNPLGNVDQVVKEAYGDGELNAAFAEVRDILLDAGNFTGESTAVDGVVFIDQIVNMDSEGNVTEGPVPGSTADIGIYEVIGPENEVYLAEEQSIAFAPGNGGAYYVGLKSPTGEPVKVVFSGNTGSMEMITISHTTDLFYEVGCGGEIVTIMNDGGALLSITKIKVTQPVNATEELQMFRAVSREEVLAAAEKVYTSVNKAPDFDIEIENPEEEPVTLPNLGEMLRGLVIRIIDDLWDWFH